MTSPNTIHLAHSPDSDDAFMFYALADGQIDTQGISYVHELQDIETLNGRAMRGELDVTAVSIHAYAYLSDRYALLRREARDVRGANSPGLIVGCSSPIVESSLW